MPSTSSVESRRRFDILQSQGVLVPVFSQPFSLRRCQVLGHCSSIQSAVLLVFDERRCDCNFEGYRVDADEAMVKEVMQISPEKKAALRVVLPFFRKATKMTGFQRLWWSGT